MRGALTMKDFRTVHARGTLVCALATTLLAAACAKHPSVPAPAPPAAPQQPETARSSAGESAGDRFFDLAHNPGAAVGTPLDPRVVYAPDVILMEEGDKAIKMAASDGMTWVFDASAPHVNELQEGKIVFATGRAVGRIGQITRAGGTVTVKLAPVQITEVIHQGHFLIDSNFRPQDLIVYTAPDFPSVLDLSPPPSAKPTTAWSAEDAIPHLVRTVLAPVPGAAPPSPATVANAAAAAPGALKSA